jgi:cell division protein ZapA (FtsZ GTPase activity inhibitor)
MAAMNNSAKTLKISILGKSYTVVTDEHEVDVQAAAEIVDSLFQEKGAGTTTNQAPIAEKMAVVIALQVAMELVKAKKVLKRYESTCVGLTGMIEQNL